MDLTLTIASAINNFFAEQPYHSNDLMVCAFNSDGRIMMFKNPKRLFPIYKDKIVKSLESGQWSYEDDYSKSEVTYIGELYIPNELNTLWSKFYFKIEKRANGSIKIQAYSIENSL